MRADTTLHRQEPRGTAGNLLKKAARRFVHLVLKAAAFFPTSGRIADFLFGYDFFISYGWADGTVYPRELAKRLIDSGFTVFLDTREFVSGENLRLSTGRRVRMSRYLVLILRPNTANSVWVKRELEIFLHTGRNPIAIDVNETWRTLPTDFYLSRIFADRLRISDATVGDLPPPDTVVAELARAFKSTRRHVLRTRFVTAAAIVLLVLAAVAFWQRNAAEASLRDSEIFSMRLLSGIGEFDKAADLARSSGGSDDRFLLARAVLDQHRSLPIRLGASDLKGGVSSLAYEKSSRTLLAIAAERLVDVDPDTGDIRHMLDAGLPAGLQPKEIFATAEAATFLLFAEATTGGTISAFLCRAGQASAPCGPIATDAPAESIEWLSGTDWGVALVAGSIMAVARRADGLRVETSLGAEGGTLAQSSDATTVAAFSDAGEAAGVVTIENGRPVYRPVRPGLTVEDQIDRPVRVLGRGAMAKLMADDRLSVRRPDFDHDPLTREISYKPWLGFVGSWKDSLLVEEPHDRMLDTADRIHMLDFGSGADLLSPFGKRSGPVWSSAIDYEMGRLYLGSHDGHVDMVALGESRVAAYVGPTRFMEPMAEFDSDILIRGANAVERTVWRLDTASGRFSLLPDFNPFVAIDYPAGGGMLASQEFPFGGELSPSGDWLAVAGYPLRVIKVAQSEPPPSPQELHSLAQRSLTDPSLIEWQPDSSVANTADIVRWINDHSFITDDFNGRAVLWNVPNRTETEMELAGEAVANIAQRGPLLLSSPSGRVWKVDSEGVPTLFGQLDDLVVLYQLDAAGRFFAASMQNPWRTAFVARHGDNLAEVVDIPSTGPLQDALASNGQVLLLYGSSVRVYKAWFPTDTAADAK